MELKEAILARHSVRRYKNIPIEEEKIAVLNREIEKINAESGLAIRLFTEEPDAFQANRPHYGSFSGCRNYFAMVGGKHEDEKIGYYGEALVLLAQTLSLNTCWVALTFEKDKVRPLLPLSPQNMLFDLIALGYGETEGVPHKSKPMEKCAHLTGDDPAWFLSGMEAAMLAPTAINQQRFHFERIGDRTVRAKALLGPCSKTDLGIVKYHFELGAGKENFEWA